MIIRSILLEEEVVGGKMGRKNLLKILNLINQL